MFLRTLVASALVVAAPVMAGAVTISTGQSISSSGSTLTVDNPTYSEVITATGSDLLLDFTFTFTGPEDDIDDFTFGVSSDDDPSDANRSFTLGSSSGALITGTGSINDLFLAEGDSVFALFAANGTLSNGQQANVGYSVSADMAPAVPLPAPALLLIGAFGGLGGFGALRRRRG